MNLQKRYLSIINWSIDHLVSIFLILFYLSEGYSKLHELVLGSYSPLPKRVKLIVLVLISVFLFFKKDISFLLKLGFLASLFAIGQSTLFCSYNWEIITVLAKYIYPIMLFRTFNILPLTKERRYILFTTFEMILILNSAMIIIGFLFDIDMFKTYDGYRFGYNGLLLTSSTGSYVYMIALFYLVLRKKFDLKAIVIIISSLLIGTKAIYLVLFVILAFLTFKRVSRKLRFWALGIILFSAFLAFYVFFFKYGIFKDITENQNLITSILSFRNQLFVDDVLPFIEENWNRINYLFGGVCDIESRSEMGFIDIMYFWGVLGGVLYLFFYYKNYFTFVFNNVTIVFFLVLVIVIALGGNFFFYSTIPIYLLIFKERILYEQRRLA